MNNLLILTYLPFLVNSNGLQNDIKNGKVTSEENELLFLRFILYFLIINKNKANIQARLARHAKLDTHFNSSRNSSFLSGKMFFGRLDKGLDKANSLEPKKGVVQKFVKRVASISAAFFIISSFSLFDYYFQSPVQGYGYQEGGVTVDEVTDQDISEIIDNVSQEDGFIMKPNLSANEAGDYSTSHEVMTYHVEPGDTVSSIAERYGIEKETIMMVNGFYDVNQLKEGMDIKILPVNGVLHTVKSGDTISGIAKKYDIAEADIVRQNQLEDAPLVPGMVLIIPGGKIKVLPPAPPKPTYVPTKNGGAKTSGSNGKTGPSSTNYVYSGPAASGTLLFPVPGGCIYTQYFHAGHYATDCANRQGGIVVAAADGVVAHANNDGNYSGGYGNYVTIDHANLGLQTLYGHFKEVYVVAGQTVKAGDPIGFMGTTGRSTGVHLHFEVRKGGAKMNPLDFF